MKTAKRLLIHTQTNLKKNSAKAPANVKNQEGREEAIENNPQSFPQSSPQSYLYDIPIHKLAAFAAKQQEIEDGKILNLSEKRLINLAKHNRQELERVAQLFITKGPPAHSGLLRGFDQTGHWFRLRDDLGRPLEDKALQKKTIDKNTTTTYDQLEQTHLLTSFVSYAHGKIEIPYASIAGEIYAPNADSFYGQNLLTVAYGIYLPNAKWVSLPKLTKIGRLPAPEIGMFFAGITAPKAEEVEIPEIEEILGEVCLPKVKKILFPKLRTLIGWLLGGSTKKLEAPRLQNLKGLFHVPNISKEDLLRALSRVQTKDLQRLLELKNPELAFLNPTIQKILMVRKIEKERKIDKIKEPTLSLK